MGPRPTGISSPQKPCNVAGVILASAFILFVAREKCGHSLDGCVADLAAARQVTSPCHTAANALLASFLSGQAAFAMLLAQLQATTRC